MKYLSPELCHEYLMKHNHGSLAFNERKNFKPQQRKIKNKLLELIGDLPEKVSLNIRVEYKKRKKDYKEIRFVFTSEKYSDVPCYLLIPEKGQKRYPVIICLQGHTTGMHLSMGITKYKGDRGTIEQGDRDFALQAISQGYAALVMEQRCFGERRDNRSRDKNLFGISCRHASMVALMLGRTMIGERVWDVSRAIDSLGYFSEIDSSRIGCMGNSGGGAITFFAACLEDRIKIAMASCYVCTFQDSIGMIDHCEDNYIPGILKYFDLPDLACLIAPRPFIIVAGKKDNLFPLKGVNKAYRLIKKIYKKADVPRNCELIIGNQGHRFYADLAWPVFRKLSGW